jgi:hypothetical protein
VGVGVGVSVGVDVSVGVTLGVKVGVQWGVKVYVGWGVLREVGVGDGACTANAPTEQARLKIRLIKPKMIKVAEMYLGWVKFSS